MLTYGDACRWGNSWQHFILDTAFRLIYALESLPSSIHVILETKSGHNLLAVASALMQPGGGGGGGGGGGRAGERSAYVRQQAVVCGHILHVSIRQLTYADGC